MSQSYQMKSIYKALNALLVTGILFTAIQCAQDQKGRTWSVYKADPESSSSSPLDEINRENVKNLQLAWTFYPNDERSKTRLMNSECNPIIIDGVMYATSARHRLYALDASTGKQLWSYDPFDGGEGGGVYRGVAYWEDGDDKRILYTAGDNLFAQNATTGKLISSFGNNGRVSMNDGLRGDPSKISVIPTSPGIVFEDLLIIGAEVSELYGAEPGYIRAYNVRSGKLEWTFHTIPHPGEPGYETWPKDACKYVGGVNNWAGMSLDLKRGRVFLGLGSPSYDFYGGDRIGQNLYGNSVVALDARTGSYKWHFQTVHHDLWDYDLPAPPNLVTVERDGKRIDAVAQTTKTGFLFVLDRTTGQPLFPVEERPVPQSFVPGEQAWPTQPFPLKPAPYSRQHMTEADLTNYSPAAHDSLVKKFRSLRYEGLFTPPDLRGTLMIPGTRGGSNWGGGAFDRETGLFYVKSTDSPELDHLVKVTPEKSQEKLSPFNRGRAIYMKHCATCHGRDRNGIEPDYPALRDIKERIPKEAALTKIMEGSGRMPAFKSILSGSEEAILAFLYDVTATRPSRADNDLFEVHLNKEAIDENSNPRDTIQMYLNVTAFGHFRDIEGRPALRPPWGTLNAIDLNTGEYAWKVVIGNHPDLQEPGAPETGSEGYGGPIVTAGGLVFIGGTHDKKFRAYDKTNGELLWETTLPAVANATPSTYYANGKQYVAISVAGDEKNPAGSIMAFALP